MFARSEDGSIKPLGYVFIQRVNLRLKTLSADNFALEGLLLSSSTDEHALAT